MGWGGGRGWGFYFKRIVRWVRREKLDWVSVELDRLGLDDAG